MPITQQAIDYFRTFIDDAHARFLREVATGREMDVDAVAALADGRCYLSGQALELGLLDAVGSEAEAYAALVQMTEKPTKQEYNYGISGILGA
jgi:protease-4